MKNLFNEETHINRNPAEFFAMFTKFINSDEKILEISVRTILDICGIECLSGLKIPSTVEADRQN